MAVHVASRLPCFLGYLLYLPADDSRRHCSGLSHIDVPGMVDSVLDIELNARELGVLLLLIHSEPAARNDQASIAINIEALLRVPSARSRCIVMLV
jgi:hypothetical protein